MRIGVSGSGALLIVALATVGLGACGTGALGYYPAPRRLVIHSGERIEPTAERMDAVEEWVREQVDSIREDPSFLIISLEQNAPAYPWETLQLSMGGDTARIWYQSRPGTYGPYLIYAHLHVMDAQNRLDRWLPELAPDATPFQIERAILSRVADCWLHQRSVFDAPDHILADAVAAIGFFLVMQIVAGRAGRDLAGPLGTARRIGAFVASLATVIRQNAQKGIGLRFVVPVEPQGRVVSKLNTGCSDHVVE